MPDAKAVTDPPDRPANRPVVSASEHLPEITPKAVILSVILAAVLAGANAYLGLFAGMTVSASIPAAVVSMAVLRLFRQSNILENNIVQTAASSGEALAAGVIFTVPALVLVGHWTTFDYWQTTMVSLVGGVLGVLFTIPLRRALIVHARLQFPEGVATAEVLKVGAKTDTGSDSRVRTLAVAAGLAGLFKFAEGGLKLWSDSLEGVVQLGRSTWYGGLNLSPALLAVGYIVGLNTALVVFLGGVLGWLLILPFYQLVAPPPDTMTGIASARATWSGQIRYVGIGAMLVGGIWTLIQVRSPVMESLRSLAGLYRRANSSGFQEPDLRTERDAGAGWIATLTVLSVLPLIWLYSHILGNLWGGLGLALVMAVAAFLFSSVAGYMAGLVGSSSNPVSGVTIATIMLASLFLLLFLGQGNPMGPPAALLVGAVVCCAAAMGGDNLQDLKTGHLVGATPWKQQIMQVIGVATGAVVIVPVLSLLQAKYGIGDVTDAHPHPLSAPQATLMANLARGVFGGSVPWHLVGFGAVVGILVITVDLRLQGQESRFRLPVLAVALGMYLPFKLSVTIVLGGLISEYRTRRAIREEEREEADLGLLAAAGLVTGEALVGILLALPIALAGIWPALSGDPFQIFREPPLSGWPGLLAMLLIAGWLIRTALENTRTTDRG